MKTKKKFGIYVVVSTQRSAYYFKTYSTRSAAERALRKERKTDGGVLYVVKEVS
jgi:hypothetical protein